MSVFFHSTKSAANPIWHMLTIVELWKPIYLMSQPPDKLYMCTYTFVCTSPRKWRCGRWDFRMADTWQSQLADTQHSVLLKRGFSLICSDGTGTPELPRHSPARGSRDLSSGPDIPTQLEIRTRITGSNLLPYGERGWPGAPGRLYFCYSEVLTELYSCFKETHNKMNNRILVSSTENSVLCSVRHYTGKEYFKIKEYIYIWITVLYRSN